MAKADKIENRRVIDGENYMSTHIIDDYASDRAAAYYADQNKVVDRPIIFEENLSSVVKDSPGLLVLTVAKFIAV